MWTGMVKKELRKSVSRRLATIKGHIGGIEKMVEEEKDCDEILFQLGAVNGSLNKLIVHILESYMTECLVEAEINDLKMLEKMKELTRTMAGILKR
ncbi:MAG: metal-sensitive transcriptional regulator [Negativicutes bacterium]|nr:metal-sensitive transcriptional regulator [Negativicutes bacterium]